MEYILAAQADSRRAGASLAVRKAAKMMVDGADLEEVMAHLLVAVGVLAGEGDKEWVTVQDLADRFDPDIPQPPRREGDHA